MKKLGVYINISPVLKAEPLWMMMIAEMSVLSWSNSHCATLYFTAGDCIVGAVKSSSVFDDLSYLISEH